MGARGVLRTIENDRLGFWCPGCAEMHAVAVAPAPNPWGFNGDYDRPTFTPSILVTSGHYVPGWDAAKGKCWCTYYRDHPKEERDFECSRCHTFVTDGRIQFLPDCTHSLAGQTVDLKAHDWGAAE